jgi:bifunctional non-homologous end joining protein LigD
VKTKKVGKLFFTPDTAVTRIKKLGDLFAPVLKLRQSLPAAFTKALASGAPPKLSTWPRNRNKSGRDHDRSLREYAAKRDHSKTPEPAAKPIAKRAKGKGIHRFVIQKHEASHLHYDWRLEMEGVLRSWAVPKGPPLKLREARLAMQVEDHPLEYADFEGTIPKGNYGAGTVMVWDHGEYEDLTGNPAEAFRAGKMHVILRGTKLTGEWILVKDRREEESNKWLLIKAGEAQTLSAKADDTSAVSQRSMKEIAKANDAQWQITTPAQKHPRHGPTNHRIGPPAFVEPMQCKAATELPKEGKWTFEIKFDGYRCVVVKSGGAVTLFSRTRKKLNSRFPALVARLAELPGDFAIDGEIVALDEQSRPSFQRLQNSDSEKPTIHFYAFDLLHRDREDFTSKPIEKRRAALDALLAETSEPVRLSPLLQGPARKILEAVEKLGLEGVIGKRVGSIYEPGERSGAWIKRRLSAEQEFVIGGYVPGARCFDSLMVGVYEKKKLLYVAKVKDGFVPRIRDEIFSSLHERRIDQCPFANLPEIKASRWGEALTVEKMKECRWVKPELVCQVAFVNWTDSGKLRLSSFVAMREDKSARTVVRET